MVIDPLKTGTASSGRPKYQWKRTIFSTVLYCENCCRYRGFFTRKDCRRGELVPSGRLT